MCQGHSPAIPFSVHLPSPLGLQQLSHSHRFTSSTSKLTVLGVQDKEKGPPLMVQKTDGGFGYDTTDMACIRQRLHEEKGEWLIYVTDMGQAPHFEAIFAGAHKAGFIKQLPSGRMPRLDHVGFGVVLGEDGKRIATRSGEVSAQQTDNSLIQMERELHHQKAVITNQ